MTNAGGPLLVMGIGNVFLRDDGAGVVVIRALQLLADRGDVELPAGTSLVDGGALGLDLLPWIANARALLLVDAIDGDAAPGTVEIVSGDTLAEARSAHGRGDGVGVDDLLSAARLIGVLPEAVALVGIQPGEIDVGHEPTGVVRAALPAAITATIDEIRRLDAIAPSPAPGYRRLRCDLVEGMKGSPA